MNKYRVFMTQGDMFPKTGSFPLAGSQGMRIGRTRRYINHAPIVSFKGIPKTVHCQHPEGQFVSTAHQQVWVSDNTINTDHHIIGVPRYLLVSENSIQKGTDHAMIRVVR